MIKPLNVEIKILIYIIAYGIYYFAVSDLIIYLEERYHFKKIPKLILELFYLIVQIFLTYNFCYKLESGYIPIYFLLFIIIGFLLYYLFMRDYFLKSLTFTSNFLIKIKPLFSHLLYSVTIVKKSAKIVKSKIRKLQAIFNNKKIANEKK